MTLNIAIIVVLINCVQYLAMLGQMQETGNSCLESGVIVKRHFIVLIIALYIRICFVLFGSTHECTCDYVGIWVGTVDSVVSTAIAVSVSAGTAGSVRIQQY